MQIYHNPRCSKSRQTLELLHTKGLEPEIVLYLENSPSKKLLKDILKKLGIKAEQLVRKSEAIFKENYKGKTLTENQWIEALVKHPKLIERPIVINGKKATIGRPPEKVLEII